MVLDLEFTAKEVDTEITGLNAYLGVSKDVDIETISTTSTVDYLLEPEARSWGIKYIAVSVKRIRCLIDWYVYAEDLIQEEKEQLFKADGIELRNGNIEGNFTIDTSINTDWEINTEVEFEPDGALAIDDVIIDLSDFSINIQ